MNDAQRIVLQMIADEKISPDEGVQLLESIRAGKADPKEDTGVQNNHGAALSAGYGHVADWLREAVSAFVSRAVQIREIERTFDARSLAVLGCKATNGQIVLNGTDADDVVVQARIIVKALKENDAKELADGIDIVEARENGRILISALHPPLRPGMVVTTHYGIQCPENLDLDLKTTNGQMELSNMLGDVDAETVNGQLLLKRLGGAVKARSSNGAIHLSDLQAKKTVELRTRNGAIRAAIGDGIAPVHLSTRNGSLSLSLPIGFDGTLEAVTRNGRIHADYPMQITTQDRRHLSAQLGGGGPIPVNLETRNGGIRIFAR